MVALKFIQKNPLMNEVTCQSIRRCDQDAVHFGHPHFITQSIQPWAIQFSSAVSVISENIPVGKAPSALTNVLSQTVQLLLNGLSLSLTQC